MTTTWLPVEHVHCAHWYDGEPCCTCGQVKK